VKLSKIEDLPPRAWNHQLGFPKISCLTEGTPMPALDAILSLLPTAGSTLTRVLLVDDDECILQSLKLVLESNGFQVVTANNVNDALKRIATETFDVLVSDLHMPAHGDGLTVVSAMRHANPRAITLIFSAYPEMELAAAAIVKQADEVVVKPLGVQNLIDAIHERLKVGTSHSQPEVESVADILERCTQSTIEEWLQSVRQEPEIISAHLDDHDRCAHLPQLFRELVFRLRVPVKLGRRAPISPAAAEHGFIRRKQGYSAAMLVEESRMLQVSIFQTLQDNLSKIDFSVLLVSVMAIADECDAQLAQQMISFIGDSKTGADLPFDWTLHDRRRQNVA
jgi:CheY-like chemotaxis protein